MRFLENEITQNPERGQLDHSFDVGCWIRANSRISRTERGQPCPRSSIISTRYRARQSRPRSLLNQPWMMDGCWVLDVGCWVLDVRCSMFSTITKWASFVKLSHALFALPFALASMVVAARAQRGWPGWRTFSLILTAMISARTCAMAFNRIADREFDAQNPR